MNNANRDLSASTSHISMAYRPYGPRMHLDEDGVGAGPDVVITAPEGTGEELSVEDAAAAYMAATSPKKKTEPTAESADDATADPESPVEDDADPAEKSPIGEDEEADPEAEKLPPIERPKSWTESEDAEWKATPRALQEKIVARELDRDNALRRSQNEAAEKLKGLTAKEQQAEQVRQQYEAKLPALMQALHNTNNTAFSDIKSQDDADLLAVVDPARWVQWKAHQDRMVSVNYELQQAEAQKTTKHQTEWQNLRNSEDAKASELIPDLKDPVKAAALGKRAVTRLIELGIDNEKLTKLADGKENLPIWHSSIQRLLADSLELADLKASQKSAVAKVAAKAVPPVQRPGTPRPPGAANSDRIQALSRQLDETGDMNVAQELYQLQQKASRRSA